LERVTILGVGASVFTLLLVTGLFLAAFAAYSLLTAFGRQPRSREMRARGETVFLPLYLREYWDWTIHPVTRLLIRLRVPPDAISWLSLLLSAAAGGAFAIGYFGMGGWLYIFGGTCDIFDGQVARATGRSSPEGAFLDSVFDRYTEMFVLGGLAFYFRDSPVLWAAIAALGGSLMVSYTRARGEGLGYSCREGGMQRAERIVYIGLAGIFGKVAEALVPTRRWSVTFLAFTVTLLAISANITAIQRFFSIRRHLRGGHEQATPRSLGWAMHRPRKAGP
jgi:CDP-diacylglycerol--glycerol-3-phosphate 3-phosphatidyltransferase